MKHVLDIGNLKQYYDKLTPEEKAIRLFAFYRILDGNPSAINELSIKAGLSEAEVKKYVEGLEKKVPWCLIIKVLLWEVTAYPLCPHNILW